MERHGGGGGCWREAARIPPPGRRRHDRHRRERDADDADEGSDARRRGAVKAVRRAEALRHMLSRWIASLWRSPLGLQLGIALFVAAVAVRPQAQTPPAHTIPVNGHILTVGGQLLIAPCAADRRRGLTAVG